MIRDYNYHNWSTFMVRKPEEAPKGSHFAGVMFDSHTVHTPAYDLHDHDSTSTVPHTVYFAFKTKDEVAMWASEATLAKKKIFFFEVKQLGSVEIKADVKCDV